VITRRQFFQGVGVGAAGSFGVGGYALAEPWGTSVTRYKLAPPRWPAGLDLKIAVIADLHACDPWMGIERIEGLVEQTNALNPDCVLLLGDYVAGDGMSRFANPVAKKDWAAALGGLKASHGVHAVLGNHDWWEDDQAQLRGCGPTRVGIALEHAGIPVYDNTSVRLVKDGAPFWIAGLGDQWAFTKGRGCRSGERGLCQGADDLAGTLRQVTDVAPVILMAHEPDIFPKVPDRVALTISGHTHGGQVRVLGYAPIVPSRYGDRYIHGHIVEEGRNLIVSAGLGCSIAPVRLGAPPEIVLIELGARA
jgi:predicted MPP superfamily phosphohydrolase